jgi:hypothetical protein
MAFEETPSAKTVPLNTANKSKIFNSLFFVINYPDIKIIKCFKDYLKWPFDKNKGHNFKFKG